MEHGFQFDRFGVRVPLILISPYIEQGTVFRSETAVPFDHTSVIATILSHFNIPKEKWQLGSRVENAPLFDFVLTRNTPRTEDIPTFKAPESSPEPEGEAPAGELPLMINYRFLVRVLQQSDYPKEQFADLYKEHFSSVKTINELITATSKILGIIRR